MNIKKKRHHKQTFTNHYFKI